MEKDKVSIRIGNGEKIHPAICEIVETAPGKPWNRQQYRYLTLICTCPGSENGRAHNKARIVSMGWDLVTCKNTGINK